VIGISVSCVDIMITRIYVSCVGITGVCVVLCAVGISVSCVSIPIASWYMRFGYLWICCGIRVVHISVSYVGITVMG